MDFCLRYYIKRKNERIVFIMWRILKNMINGLKIIYSYEYWRFRLLGVLFIGLLRM